MRYALSSSEASDNEGPSSSLPPLRDLRTVAGKAGITKAEGSTQSKNPSSPQASSSSLRRTASARRRTQVKGSDEEDEGQASSSGPRPRRVAASQSKASTKTLPPWIKPLRYKSTQQDAGKDDAQEEDSRSKLRPSSRRPRPSLSSRRVSFQASDSSGSSSVDRSSCDESDLEAKEDEGLVKGSDTSDSDEELPWPSKSRSKGKGKEVLRSIRLAADEESFEGEWADPLRKNRPQWRSLVSRLSGQLDATTLANNKSNPPITSIPDDFDEIQATLARLRLEKEEEEKKDRLAFEAREKKLWATIEGAIQAAENEAKRQAKEEADREAAVKRAKEEEERKTRETKEAEEKKKKQEEEAKQQALRTEQEKKLKADEEAKKLQAAAAEREASKGMGGGDALRSQARVDYEKWSNKMKDIKENILPTIAGNPAWKKQCFAAKRQITPKVGQLTNSRAEIFRITEFFSNLLNEAKSAGPDPQKKEIYIWVLNHLSKCLIRQAEQEVAVKLDTAFPLARVVCWLIMMGHQELGDVLMARLIKKSCWCLGFVPGQTSTMDAATHSKLIGRSSPQESTVQFTSRQSGIVAFYFAICQTTPLPPSPTVTSPTEASNVDASSIPPHFRPSALWTWQARYLTPPMTDHSLSPAFWSTLIEIAGPILLRNYANQQVKLWTLLYDQGIMNGKAGFVTKEEGKANSGRLQLVLEEWKRKGGKVDVMKGRQMEA